MRHTDRLGISSHDLTREAGLTWVLHRQAVRCRRWPVLGEALSVVTLPTRIDRNLITYRDFYLLDSADRILGCSASTWSVMDLQSRRIRSIPAMVTDALGELPPPGAGIVPPANKPSPPVDPTARTSLRVRFSHLDFNNHLTNPAFPELMLEPLGMPFLVDHLPTMADMVYHREARYGEGLEAVVSPGTSPGTYDHALYRGGGELLASMQTRWRKTE